MRPTPDYRPPPRIAARSPHRLLLTCGRTAPPGRPSARPRTARNCADDAATVKPINDSDAIAEEQAEDWQAREEALAEIEQERLQAILDEHWTSPDVDAFEDFRAAGRDLQDVDITTDPDWILEGFQQRGERAALIANYGEGKTQAAVQYGLQVAEKGLRVIYLDYENAPREMAERLQMALASYGPEAAAAARANFAYTNDPETLTDPALFKAFGLAVRGSDLVIWDSMTRILQALGADENSNAEVTAVMQKYIDPIMRYGVANLMLDNTGWADGSRARGAISKAATVEAVWKVSGGREIDENNHGLLTLERTRSRSGKLAGWFQCGAGGGDYSRLVPLTEAPPKSQTEKSGDLRWRIGSLICGSPDRVFGRGELEKQFKIAKTTAYAHMKALVDEGTVETVAGGWKASGA